MKNKWTNEQIKYLKDNYKVLNKIELSTNLGVSYRGLEIKMSRLKLSSNEIHKELINCLYCNKEIKVLKKQNRKFCSHKCSASFNNIIRGARTEETKNKISLSNKGRSNPRKGKKLNGELIEQILNNCKVCSKTCKRVGHIYCSKICQSNCLELKTKASIRMKERFKVNPNLHPNRKCAGIKESYPEKMFTEYLEQLGLKLNVDYYKQYKLYNYYIDFVIPNKNLAIEIDGKYWHNPQSEKEIKRENIIKEKFNLIRLDASLVVKKYYHNEIGSILKN